MRRVVLAVLSTVGVLAILLSYKTQSMNATARTGALGSPLTTFRPDDTPVATPPPAATSSAPVDPTTSTSASTQATATQTGGASAGGSGRPSPGAKPTTKPTTRHTSRPSSTPTAPVGDVQGYSGSAVETRYGLVQVRINVESGRITRVTILQIPDEDDVDRDVNDTAVPQLVSQTLDRQSAALDVVSGATYTSNAYMASLQSAIDAAGL